MPHTSAPNSAPAGLKVGKCVGGPPLSQSQTSAGGRDEHRPDTRGPPLLREQAKQHLPLVKLTRLDSDIGRTVAAKPSPGAKSPSCSTRNATRAAASASGRAPSRSLSRPRWSKRPQSHAPNRSGEPGFN